MNDDVITTPGLWFYIRNNCSSAVSGLAVGDELRLLEVGSATFMTPVLFGDLADGEKVQVAAGAGSDGNGVILFVPPPGTSMDAVRVTVSPNQTVDIPSSFCGISGKFDNLQLKVD